MKLATKKLIKGSQYPDQLESLLCLAEKAYKTFQPTCSFFLCAPILYEIKGIIDQMHEINCIAYGGFLGAERQRVLFQRTSGIDPNTISLPPISGLQVEGNFLFDKTTTDDFLNQLKAEGLPSHEIGDIWLIGDQGAEMVCTPEAGKVLNEKKSFTLV